MSGLHALGRHVPTADGGPSRKQDGRAQLLDSLTAKQRPQIDSILVVGPPQSGKSELAIDMLGHYADDAVFATTNSSAERVETAFTNRAGTTLEHLHIVESTTYQQTGAQSLDSARVTKTGRNTTAVGVSITNAIEAINQTTDSRLGIGIDSLSHFLLSGEGTNVYRFTKAYVDLAKAPHSIGVATVDTGIGYDNQTTALRHYFDVVVETRTDPVRGYRTRTNAKDSDWIEF